jgi:glycerol-3-phosphate dehydrogenase
MQTDPAISLDEAVYLVKAVQRAFPSRELVLDDVLATFSGVRPVVDTGKADPCKESREHVLWCEDGLLTVTGGKLTTFRLMARDALKAAWTRLPQNTTGPTPGKYNARVLDPLPKEALLGTNLNPSARLRLLGRYGANAPDILEAAGPDELDTVPGTTSLWAEIRWTARAEAVVHLDDLLLRRLRLGLSLPYGGCACMNRIRRIVQPELGWDDRRWEQELSQYMRLWERSYDLPVN